MSIFSHHKDTQQMDPKHLYKCPGLLKSPHGVTYSLKGVSTPEEEKALKDLGWFDSLEEAATECGPSCLYREFVRPKRGVNKFAHGLPYVKPKPEPAPEPEPVEELDLEHEEVPQEEPETVIEEIHNEETEIEEVVPEPEPEEKPRTGKLSDEDREEIVTMLHAGKKNSDIAKKYGVSPQSISLIKKKNGL